MDLACMGVFPIGGPFVKAYLLVEQASVTLIDAGLKGDFKRIQSEIEKRAPGRNLDLILITHADGDHYGCLASLKQHYPGLIACASEIEAQAIREGGSSREPHSMTLFEKIFSSLTGSIFSAEKSEVNRIIFPGEEFDLLGGLRALDTRGHTPGHLSFFCERERILFAGDSISEDRGKPSEPRGSYTWDKTLSDKSFKEQMDLKPRWICAGHTLLRCQ